MSNSVKIAIVSLITVIIIVAVFFFIYKSEKSSEENNQAVQNNVNQESLLIEDASQLEEESLTPQEMGLIDIIDIVKEQGVQEDFMTVAEKEKMGLDPAFRVQVLARDEAGSILGYTILPDGADPVVDVEKAIGWQAESASKIEQ